MNFVLNNALEKFVKMTHTTFFDQKKLVFEILELNMNPELVLKMPKVYMIICSLRFHFKVKVLVDF